MGLGLMLIALAFARLRRLRAAAFWCTLVAGAIVIGSVAVFRSISITMQTLNATWDPGWHLAYRIGSLVYRAGILGAFTLLGLAVASLIRRPNPAPGTTR
jgi:hypothetical protein